MERKLVLTSIIVILLTSLLGVAFRVEKVQASGTIYIRADGSIDPLTTFIVTADNTTYTFAGNIYDSIVVERDNIVVDGAGYSVHGSGIGIDLGGRRNVTIQYTNIDGLYGGYGGIRLYKSSNNKIIGNNITGNSWYGIFIYESSYNTLRNNGITNNAANFGIFGSTFSHFINNVDTSNVVNGKPIYYWISKHDTVIPPDAGYVALINCTGITVQNLNLTKNLQGVLLANTTNSTMTQNNIARSPEGTEGILLWNSPSNTISENNITAFGRDGVKLHQSSNNGIARNNITCNDYHGLYLYESSNNTISGNYITDTYGFSDSKGVILIKSSNNTIDGNFVINNDDGGIQLVGSSNNTINSNEVKDNGYWSDDYGIELTSYSDYNVIIGNNITRNTSGIGLSYAYYNTLINNNITNNMARGVQFETASYNTLRNNTISGNKRHNFGIFTRYKEVRLSTYIQNIDTSNTVNGKPIYYLVDQEGLTIDSSDIGYLGLVNCTNIRIKNVALSDNGQGLLLAFTSNSTIENATIVDNGIGIHVMGSDANTITSSNITDNNSGVNIYLSSLNNITKNTITNNGISMGVLIMGWGTLWQSKSIPCEDNSINSNIMLNGGIFLSNKGVTRTSVTNNFIMKGSIGISLDWGASNNTIYHNNFIDNVKQVTVNNDRGNCTNIWDDGYPSGGNYWSDYNGTDVFSGVYQNEIGSDGIGDVPYIIDKINDDNFPLVRPIVLLPGDVNLDGIVDIFDLILGVAAYQSTPGEPNWNPFADLAPKYEQIDLFDLVTIAYHYGESW